MNKSIFIFIPSDLCTELICSPQIIEQAVAFVACRREKGVYLRFCRQKTIFSHKTLCRQEPESLGTGGWQWGKFTDNLLSDYWDDSEHKSGCEKKEKLSTDKGQRFWNRGFGTIGGFNKKFL